MFVICFGICMKLCCVGFCWYSLITHYLWLHFLLSCNRNSVRLAIKKITHAPEEQTERVSSLALPDLPSCLTGNREQRKYSCLPFEQEGEAGWEYMCTCRCRCIVRSYRVHSRMEPTYKCIPGAHKRKGKSAQLLHDFRFDIWDFSCCSTQLGAPSLSLMGCCVYI